MRKRRNGNTRPAPETKRCAIYTRKSTSIGLNQDFNTLDAQRKACEWYIKGQAHDGWQIIPDHYDDGGFTGANLERPAFQCLLSDIEAGKIDIVVVYKVDRLSRSLLDFAQVMSRFNQAGAAFFSVTQNFSTADAMGRLTLNMLMSFAEFEREMIAERTRDKIAAARRKGKWTDGAVLRILKNPVLAGYMSSGGELFEAEHTAIVDQDRWSRTTELLDGKAGNKKKQRGRNPAYLLRGILRCGRCGQAMTPASTRKKGRRRVSLLPLRDPRQGGHEGLRFRPATRGRH